MTFTEGKIDSSNKKELAEFNSHLESRSYVNGYTPTYEDLLAFKCFTAAPAKSYQHVARWYKHIASFDATESAIWPKQGGVSEAGNGVLKPTAGGDDDFNLFEDDSDDEEKKRITEERLKAYNEKKSKKPGPIAKSNVIFDVKPWDDTIEIKDIEKAVRSISMDGLLWGPSKVLPIAFGINKLQIGCVIEDLKVSTDILEEEITNFEDLVQSIDIVAFNKV